MIVSLSEASARLIGFLGGLILLLIGGLLGYTLVGYWCALTMELVLIAGMVVLRPLLSPPWWGRSKARILTLLIFGGMVSNVQFMDWLILPPISWLYQQLGWAKPVEPSLGAQAGVLTVFGTLLVLITLIFEKYQIFTPSAALPPGDNLPFPKLDYLELRDRFCKYMVNVLNQIDEETNWSDGDFTRLEAEVELERKGGSRPKIVRDLVAAIRDDHTSRAFLLIGDPGSGKSVSLRRLTRELYGRVKATGIVPIYINLREWNGASEPTDEQVMEFIRSHLLRVSGRAGKAFIENWFDPMLSHGRFFFVLDSFDEMPAVLDCEEHDSRLAKISSAFDRFLNDIHNCRGVLSSRPFRQPVGIRARRLTIRPFNEGQVRSAMRKWLKGSGLNADLIVRAMLRQRPELSSTLRNPFMADLVAQYVISKPKTIPENAFVLYDQYVHDRLTSHARDLADLGVTVEQVLDAAMEIASTIYSGTNMGLEVDRQAIMGVSSSSLREAAVKAMAISRLARFGGVDHRRFSFVHRRFAEFFAARCLVRGTLPVHRESIPTDSRWRDGLVVYCGIAPIDQVQGIVDYAWAVIKQHGDALLSSDFRLGCQALHCLRFLRDTCLSRPELLKGFRADLSRFIESCVESNDTLVVKVAAESAALCTAASRTEVFVKVLDKHMAWLSETVIRSFRHLASLERTVLIGVRNYLSELPAPLLLQSFRDLDFSLSLSRPLRTARISLWFDRVQMLLLWALFVSVLAMAQDRMRLYGLLSLVIAVTVEWMAPIMRAYAIDCRSNATQARAIRRNAFVRLLLAVPFRGGFDTSLRIGVVWAASLMMFSGVVRSFFSLLPPRQSSGPSALWGHRVPILHFLVGCVTVIPWDIWVMLANSPKRWARDWRDTFTRVAITLGSMACLAAIGSVLVWIWKYLPSWIQLGLLLILTGYGVLLLVLMSWDSTRFMMRELFRGVGDRYYLRSPMIPQSLEWDAVQETLSSIKTDWGQARYLEQLRVRMIAIKRMPTRLTVAQLAGPKSAEQLARLREQVYGLQE